MRIGLKDNGGWALVNERANERETKHFGNVRGLSQSGTHFARRRRFGQLSEENEWLPFGSADGGVSVDRR